MFVPGVLALLLILLAILSTTKDKEEIIRFGTKLGVDFAQTVSCYNAKKRACGTCLACMLRKEGFYWAGMEDPASV